METEANLTQETETVEVEPQVEEAVQAEEAVAVDQQPESAEPENTVPEAAEPTTEEAPEEAGEAAEPQADAEVAEEAPEAAEPQADAEVAEAAEPTSEEAVEAAEPVAEEVVAEQPAEDVVVATEDVAPARSRMELARLAKESLIERAKALADSTDWRKTSDEQRTLMEEWRKIGYAGKETNDKLWADFREARQAFFSRREEEVVGIKREIIAEAKALTENVGNWAATSSKLDDLMARWKTAGNSGSDSDKELWDEFNAIRRDFRNRRKADLDKRRATTQANAQAKAEIVAEAKAIAETEEYTREHSDRMRQLDKDYKAIGFAGKPANDTLWEEFSAAKNAYWAGNNAHLDERRRQRAERLQEVMDRKEDQIEHLKTQNETLTARLGSTLNPEKLEQIKRWIAQNEERVDDLEDDIGDIRRKI